MAVSVTLQPVIAEMPAQSAPRATDSPTPRQKEVGDRRFRFLGIGAAIGGLLALGYYQLSDGGERSGRCMPINCALPYLTISGGISGLFIARERAAQRRAETPRAGESLMFRFTETLLPTAANGLGVRDSVLAVATDSGVVVLSSGPRISTLRRRGAGLSNIRSVAITGDASTILIGTGTALWETPTSAGVLSRVVGGGVGALAAHGNTVVAAVGEKLVVRRTMSGSTRVDSLDAGTAVSSVRHDAFSGHWWVTADSSLFELTVSDSSLGAPVLTKRSTFGGEARAVAAASNWVAVALGSDGLAIWPRASLTGRGVTTPIVLRGEPRFAFDLAFVNDALFVAGGVDGITHVELSVSPRIVGSSRQAGYATIIEAVDGVLWVGDRSKNRVMRIVP